MRPLTHHGHEHDPAEHLRPDFALDDLILMLMANDGIRATSPATRVAASRRFAALAIQAFHASPEASPLLPTHVLSSTFNHRVDGWVIHGLELFKPLS